jgi:hypothetical protein
LSGRSKLVLSDVLSQSKGIVEEGGGEAETHSRSGISVHNNNERLWFMIVTSTGLAVLPAAPHVLRLSFSSVSLSPCACWLVFHQRSMYGKEIRVTSATNNTSTGLAFLPGF